MKKLLLLAMLTSFLAVNAQNISKDFKPVSTHLKTANYYENAVNSGNLVVEGWNLSKTVEPPVELYETGNIVVEGWQLSKTVEPPVELSKYGNIKHENWQSWRKFGPRTEHR